MKPDLSVVLPAYEEAKNLNILLPELKQILNEAFVNYEIIIVDIKEPKDNTEEVCSLNNVIYVNRTGGNTYGDAVRTGISLANGEKIAFMDSDCSHRPEDLIKLYRTALQGNDIVIGSRYIKGGDSDNSLILKLMSRTVNLAYKIVLGIKINDVSNSFRIYKSNILSNLILTSSNFDIVEEILVKAIINNKNIIIIEYPVYFKQRNLGKSKRNLWAFAVSYVHSLYNLYLIKLGLR